MVCGGESLGAYCIGVRLLEDVREPLGEYAEPLIVDVTDLLPRFRLESLLASGSGSVAV